VSVLLSEGVNDGHDALGEVVSALALRAEALLAPQDEAPEFALGVVVGGLDCERVGEG